MKKAIVFGAGNIGRGFIGKLFSEAGYEVCFIDIDEKVISKLNEDRCYPVKIVSNEEQNEVMVKNVCALNIKDIEAVAEKVTQADIAATAVGVKALPFIIKPICVGLKRRTDKNGKPLNIILCENLLDVNEYVKQLIKEEIGSAGWKKANNSIGFVKASVERMVPVITDSMRGGNFLRVWVEPHEELPVDRAAFVGEIAQIKHMTPFSPFEYYIKRKLYIHNMAHAVCAYLGWQKGCKHIYECLENDELRHTASCAIKAVSEALQKEFSISNQVINTYIKDLLDRFKNKALGDTVERVARDPIRKLGKNDRLVGAALYCLQQKIDPESIVKGIAAALKYDNGEDEEAVIVQKTLRNCGVDKAISEICELDVESTLARMIRSEYQDALGGVL